MNKKNETWEKAGVTFEFQISSLNHHFLLLLVDSHILPPLPSLLSSLSAARYQDCLPMLRHISDVRFPVTDNCPSYESAVNAATKVFTSKHQGSGSGDIAELHLDLHAFHTAVVPKEKKKVVSSTA